jgi:hypothetical protein
VILAETSTSRPAESVKFTVSGSVEVESPEASLPHPTANTIIKLKQTTRAITEIFFLLIDFSSFFLN